MKKLKLAVLPGDGIGQDVMFSSLPVFDALNISVDIILGDIGWECWKKEGDPVPQKTWEIIKSSDAVLLGATTSMPEKEAIDALPESIRSQKPNYVSPIIQLRQKLDLYVNVRPCFNIKNEAENFNFCVIRENTEGLYSGLDFFPLPNELQSLIAQNPQWHDLKTTDASCSFRLQSRKGLERLFEFAFQYAESESLDRVTFADKPNVLRKSSAFAREIFEAVAQKYPHIKPDIHNVDAVALWMIRRPQEFGVIVAENMFGDILSDVGAGVMGGLGFAPSANIGVNGCYFEPVHGSAPRVKTNCANPSALFLTIGLLLKHFGYHAESDRIKSAVQSVIQEGKWTTYDLGGSASTDAMAKAIIERCILPKHQKVISFLMTGNEIVRGDIQDTNSQYFSKTIYENGGHIYQHVQVSDKKNEIATALKYLLSKSDLVITCGGLGPTSDDNTRFAIAEIVKKELVMNESAWNHVVNRLKKFDLPVADANRQQALFPREAMLYPNEHGTAYGAYIEWENKSIIMLPGPPRECHPMFEKYVVPTLFEKHFFIKKQQTYRWLTLGLIEGEIAPKIDGIVDEAGETGYRWCYPYLEIKFTVDQNINCESVLKKIKDLISENIISDSGKDAFEILENQLDKIQNKIFIEDKITNGAFLKKITSQNLLSSNEITLRKKDDILFSVMSISKPKNNERFSGSYQIECEAFIRDQRFYSHTISIPNRGPEVTEYAQHYMAWQLGKIITVT